MKNRSSQIERLRRSVEFMPRPTREAMLRGIDGNEIVAGSYTDKDGGVCPMLAAHRAGGRTSYSSFARAWDGFTGARTARRATEREVRVLRSHLEMSLMAESTDNRPLTQIAAELRTERAQAARRRVVERRADGPVPTGERDRSAELRNRSRWSWLVPVRRYDDWKRLVAAAEEQLAEQRAGELAASERFAEPSPH
ncbi:MAG: hypothetical protein ACR2NA_13790 [Solirubrobacterales bacterium]